MLRVHIRVSILVLAAAAALCGTAEAARRPKSAGPALATKTARPAPPPHAFGLSAYTVTSLSDLSFTTFDSALTFTASLDDYFRYITSSGGGSFVAGAVVPAGAIIDYLGLGSCDELGDAFFLNVFEVGDDGSLTLIGEFASGAHGVAPCTTDYNADALAYPILGNAARTIQIEVVQNETAPTDGSVRFSSVELWWHREVSPAPATATFGDVPTDHPFFQFIEALASSGITVGCGAGNYCPGDPVTRGQLAVLLAKALGLHWPGNPAQ